MVEEMKVREGYKKTEIGVIPRDWEVVDIESVAIVSTGGKNTQDKISSGKYPFYVRSSKVERINSYSYDGEAILTAGDGVGTGKVFHYVNGKFDFHQRVYKISDFRKCLNGYYLYLYFSNNFFERVMGMTAKSSVDSVRREMITDMLIPMPKLIEQKLIAKVLRDTDNLIQSIQNLIYKKEKIKQGTMQELLTCKKRLDGFSDEWEIKKLGDIYNISAGPDLDTSKYSNDKTEKYKYPIYSNALTNKGLYGYSSDYTNNENSITVTARGMVGNANFRAHKYCAIGRILILEPKQLVDNYLVSQIINECIKFTLESTGVPQLTRPKISKYKIQLPKDIEEQKAIAQILSDMDQEIQGLKEKLEKYKTIKQGMMQELLTGRIRLI